MDGNTGATLHEQGADEPRHPASLTKMMTLYLVFEQIELGKLSYTTRIKVSQEAASAAPSKLDLDPGEEMSVGDAIKALITKSANDVAIALAEHIGGSESRFAQLMNSRARQIGMTASHFRNASGLPDPEQVTTARDMVVLGLRLQDDFPRHYALFQLRQFTYDGSTYRNHNTLLFNFLGTEGIKTGYTRMSGFNLVASVRRDGKHVVGAVFGGGSGPARDAHMRMLLTRALARASTEKTRRTAPAPMIVARGRPVPAPVPASRPLPQPPAAKSEPRHEVAMVAPRPPLHPVPTMVPPQPVEVSRGHLASGQPGREELPLAREPRPATRVMVPRVVRPAEARPPAGFGEMVQTAREPVQKVAVLAPPVPVPVANPHRGVPPSTLQAQAERLGGPQLRPQLSPGVPLPGPGAAALPGPLEIQVGAFPTVAAADRQLGLVRSKAPSQVQGRQPRVIPVSKGDRQLYRARFAGFDSASAAQACLELRRQAIDCFVMRAE